MDRFLPATRVRPHPQLSRHIVVARGELLCIGNHFVHTCLDFLTEQPIATHNLGELSGQPCGVHLLAEAGDFPGRAWRGLRSLLGAVNDEMFALAGRALQVVSWDCDHRFCGRCGRATEYSPAGERARICPSCELVVYPRISPCVIMLVTRGEECLLARHTHHRHGLFTALAGFIEPGESAEQAVAREVREEVGVSVGQPHYVGSQPWPFPGQLMLGYRVPWKGGDLSLDPGEIADARWFNYRELPGEIPPPQTLSGQLIRGFAAAASGNPSEMER
ncbi:NAD(+) diphosphatase [Microbulbifer yueqingensis]|uniref:NAD(+) diphosphatase n=1 Tax=Microbulbifer yueqingensis TaxID=658219 RepID=A0A1G9AHP2_9GAMM|nr:NAD(+) diphosphatase [Microbulbifer yueqingensis]SDK26080.1 NAD+ diphosphatase [Microbulbifer yueqingensis]